MASAAEVAGVRATLDLGSKSSKCVQCGEPDSARMTRYPDVGATPGPASIPLVADPSRNCQGAGAAARTRRPLQDTGSTSILPGSGSGHAARHMHQVGTRPNGRRRRPLRRGVRDPWCACPPSWHRAVSCPSALVETPAIRAVNRGPHADDALDADTRLAGRPSTVGSATDVVMAR